MVTRRELLKLMSSTLSLSLISSFSCSVQVSRKPNFIFILVDDLGWKDLGCCGSTFYETPNLDRLADQGMRFTQAYASCPVCSPTRASIMTGKYPARLNITDWIPGQDPKNQKLFGPQDLHQLPLEEQTIAEILKQNGYKTFFAGKWHLGGMGFYPENQGFEINKGGHDKGSPPGGYYSPYNNPKLSDGPEGEYLTDRLTNESIQFMEKNQNNPFFLYLSFYTVHTPIQACVRHLEKFKLKVKDLPLLGTPDQLPEHEGFTKQRQDDPEYASMIYAMDENVGRLLDRVDSLNLSRDTIIIFTSDNGGRSTLYRSGYPTSNLPLRAGKGWCYEGGIRIPQIIRAPGITPENSICDFPVISMDFYPTILDLAGIKKIPQQHYDGMSLLPLLEGEKDLERESIFWHYPHYHGSAWTPGAAVRSGDWKLIEFYDKEKVELYHLKEDRGEQNNLAEILPQRRNKLLELLHWWQKEVGAQKPEPNPDYKTE